MAKSDRRFNSEEYLRAYAMAKRFPAIHDSIFFAASRWASGPLGDICSSTGLLGRRFHDLLGLETRALEGSLESVNLGTRYGVYGLDNPATNILVQPSAMGKVAEWLHGLHTLVARRCLCEISEKVPLVQFAKAVAEAGVKIVALEGRLQSVKSVHPFGHADKQAQCFLQWYDVIYALRDIRVLKAKAARD